MKIARWGNSLAVRLPAETVRNLGLKEGESVEIMLKRGGEELDLGFEERRRRAVERMRAMQVTLPPGYKFDREEANRRGE